MWAPVGSGFNVSGLAMHMDSSTVTIGGGCLRFGDVGALVQEAYKTLAGLVLDDVAAFATHLASF